MWGFGRSPRPRLLEPERGDGLTLLRSSSCCCSNSGTAAMATRTSSGGRLAVRGKKRLDRRRQGTSQRRPRPRLRKLPSPTGAGGLETPPPSQKPRERRVARHVLPPTAASPVPAAVHLGAGQRSYAGPTLAPGRAETTGRSATQERETSKTLSEARLKKDRALLRGNLLVSQGPRWRRAVTYTRSRESDRVRFGGARATAGGEGRPTNRVSVYGGEPGARGGA